MLNARIVKDFATTPEAELFVKADGVQLRIEPDAAAPFFFAQVDNEVTNIASDSFPSLIFSDRKATDVSLAVFEKYSRAADRHTVLRCDHVCRVPVLSVELKLGRHVLLADEHLVPKGKNLLHIG